MFLSPRVYLCLHFSWPVGLQGPVSVCMCTDVYTHIGVHPGVLCVWPLPTPIQRVTKSCPLGPSRIWPFSHLHRPPHLDVCNNSLCVSDFAPFSLFST